METKFTTIQKQNRSSIDTNKVQSLIETNNHLLQEISILKSNIEQLDQQLQQMDEREQMLLQYPDLNGPIEQEPSKIYNILYQLYLILFYLATNNIVIDMQNQLRTNEMRIELLRKQNDSLKSSLEKLLAMNSQPLVSEERYEELRSQSRQEQPYRRYSYGNETVTPVDFFFLNHLRLRTNLCNL